MPIEANDFIAVCISASAGIVAALIAKPDGEGDDFLNLTLHSLPHESYAASEYARISNLPEVLKVSKQLLSDKSLSLLEFRDQEVLAGYLVSVTPVSLDHQYIDRFVCHDIDTLLLVKADQQSLYSKLQAVTLLDSLSMDEEGISAPSAKLLAENVRNRLNKALLALDTFEQDSASANFCSERSQRFSFYYDEKSRYLTLSADGFQRAVSTDEMVGQILSTARINHENYNELQELREKRKRLLAQVDQIDAELAEAGK